MDETKTLARFIAQSRWSDVPDTTRHEAKRAILNWLGCAIGGCRDDTVERALRAITPFSGPPGASVIGRAEKLDTLNAALINGLSSNILDFDDTHMKTVIHPSVPVAAAALAFAEHHPVTGAELLHAFILGVETECRIGNAMPHHYAAGWHITATCGVFGAAAAAGRMLGLDAQRMTWALGVAATQAAGLTATMGSMSKSYNMGHAAKSGLLAALLAERGFTSSDRALEAPRGFLRVLGGEVKTSEISGRLGETWELSWNAYKPFPCGIVLHAAIDGCLQLRQTHALSAQDVKRVEVRLNPLALELAGKPAPAAGLEGKLSARHAVAVALLHGKAGVDEFTDACVNDARVTAFREKVATTPDSALDKAAAIVRIEMQDGSRYTREVPHAIGSLEKPMTDSDIEQKFIDLAAGSMTQSAARAIADQIWSLENLNDSAELPRATARVPETH
ncbi:MAG TPA: MmgE/PrpD family protein [Burkholderiales bacterium]|nr:MmgE/PrpD family protein [Burkholderiales bacterium]